MQKTKGLTGGDVSMLIDKVPLLSIRGGITK